MGEIFKIAISPAPDAETESGFTEKNRWAWILKREWGCLHGELGEGDGVDSVKSMEAMAGVGCQDQIKGSRNLLGVF